jgi:hypothetical protein
MLIQVDGASDNIGGAIFAAVEMIILANHLMLEGHSHEEIDRVCAWDFLMLEGHSHDEIDRVCAWDFRSPVAEYTDVVID